MTFEVREAASSSNAFRSIEYIDANTRRALRQAFFQIGWDLKRTLNRAILSRSQSGRIYRVRRGKVRRRHRASAPGETPANLSGDYRKSVGFKVQGAFKLIFGAGSNKVPYAEYLEHGTKNMSARPGLRNSIDANERNAISHFESNLKRQLVIK